ncbi:ABC transporter ATP-binding protein [Cellulomonas denverensis]|uniref:ABC transporter ATP-binding protein n=1 Tax=Cellulomonas denverensis TaxID=264297 RepID=A0A7X6KU61_9CELL|nr:ABC transporter ATP-binding protein [Cellulomonas denverensis]NKY22039.1 ABC transporter ATP-binding protein [Cellulomonas denverensis]GIG27222.1 hypothetical protein Cde04nite_34660 [Cellulomonas denverensis]
MGRGRAFGLLGPNGSGKTTTVRLLTGLLTRDAGQVALFGEPLTDASADRLRRRIGVQTDTALYETLTVRENLRLWGELHGVDRSGLDHRVDEVLDVLGLLDRGDSRVGELSKGMRQKAAIGRAVLHRPDLLFLDEPTAGLDPEASADLIAYLHQLIRAASTTVIICTHQLHGLEALCDDVGIIEHGRLLAAGPVEELLHRRWPRSRYRFTVGGEVARARAVAAEVLDRAPRVIDPATGLLEVTTPDPAVIPAVVAALVRHDVPVHAVVPDRPTIEELYFATIDDRGAA